MLNQIKSNIEQMKKLGLHHFKMETEAEGLTISDMLARMAIMRPLKVPVWVKIGGCEAIGDIKACQGMGVDGITAPMIESSSAFEKFINAKRDLIPSGLIAESINIETYSGYQNMSWILPRCRECGVTVTIGTSDLRQSLHQHRVFGDKKQNNYIKEIAGKLKSFDIPFSIGGGITPHNVNQIIDDYQPDYVNTRNFCFYVGINGFVEEKKKQGHPLYISACHSEVSERNAIILALETEILLLQYFAQPTIKRVEELQRRLKG